MRIEASRAAWCTLIALALAACSSPPPRPPAPPPPRVRPPPATPPTTTPAPVPVPPVVSEPRPTLPTPPRPPAAPPAVPRAPAPEPEPSGPLAAEHRWLADLFEGTPVQVRGETGSAVRLDVPLEFSFDDGSSEPKAPLQAVLQKLHLSMLRQPAARLAVGAPAPDAAQRQRAIRAELVALGLPSYRVSGALPVPAGGPVVLRLTLVAGAVQRLQDQDLPPHRPPGVTPEPAR